MHQYHAGAAAAVAVAWTWRLERAQRAGWRGRRDGEETVTERAPMGPGGHALHASCRAVAGWLVQWARVGSAMHACMFDRSAAPLRTTQLASLPLFPKGILRRAVEGRTANARVTGRDRTYCIYLTTGIPATLSVRRSADLHNVISHPPPLHLQIAAKPFCRRASISLIAWPSSSTRWQGCRPWSRSRPLSSLAPPCARRRTGGGRSPWAASLAAATPC